jgi:hypothetical protein
MKLAQRDSTYARQHIPSLKDSYREMDTVSLATEFCIPWTIINEDLTDGKLVARGEPGYKRDSMISNCHIWAIFILEVLKERSNTSETLELIDSNSIVREVYSIVETIPQNNWPGGNLMMNTLYKLAEKMNEPFLYSAQHATTSEERRLSGVYNRENVLENLRQAVLYYQQNPCCETIEEFRQSELDMADAIERWSLHSDFRMAGNKPVQWNLRKEEIENLTDEQIQTLAESLTNPATYTKASADQLQASQTELQEPNPS